MLFALPAALLGLAALLIRPDSYKPRIEALVEAQTGRQLLMNGPIRLAWSLQPTITMSDVRLLNLPGGSRADMARVERIEAAFSIPALLHRQIRITRLTLIGPNILLEPVASKPNWVFQPDTESAAPSKATPAGGFSLRIDSAHIQNGMVTFHFPERTNVIGLRTLDYAHERWSEPLRLDAVLVYRDFQPFTVHARSTPTGGPLAPWTTLLDAAAFDATLHARGTTSLAGPYDLAVSLDAPALETLNQLLPSMQLPALHGLHLSTHIATTEAGLLPVPGQTSLHADSADLRNIVPGLSLSGLQLDLPREGGIASLRGNGHFRTQPFGLDGTLHLPPHLDGHVTGATTLSITAGEGDRLSARGTLALLNGGFDGFDGMVSARVARLDRFRPIGPSSLPALTGLSAEAGLTLAPGLDRATIRDLVLRTTEGELSGDATLLLGAKPAVTATLRSTRLQLDPLLSPNAHNEHAPFLTTALPWNVLDGNKLDVNWQGSDTVLHGAVLPDLGVHLVLGEGRLAAQLSGAALHGTIGAERSSRSIRLALQADRFPVEPLAVLAGLPDPAANPVAGTVHGAVDLFVRGETAGALAATLNGTFALATADVAMSNATLSAIAAPAIKQLGATLSRSDRTVVRCFGIRGTAAAGLLKLSTLALDTSSLVLSGVGTIDLAKQTVALKLHPLARLAGSRVSVPVLVQGPFSSPAATVDAGGMGKVGLLLDALFGGDHPKTCEAAGLAG